MQISDVCAIVTGAANGIGRCFALELLKSGASVLGGDVDVRRLDELHAECAGFPGALYTHRLDVMQEASVAEFVEWAFREAGEINVLVNNAGILRDGLLAKHEEGWIKTLPKSQWRQVLDTNLTGPYLMARETVAEMIRRCISGGVVANISSISRLGNSGQSNYSASKAGLDACTRTWALELAEYGFRVAGIAPGLIRTSMLGHISEDAMSAMTARIPLKRVGLPEDIWIALKFILECEYFTGRTIEVDGGLSF
jgi:3-oxoacyl-[acyl-carrier protein] reductase